MTEIYLVTTGDYSAYTVDAAFSDKGLAHQYAAHLDDDAEVETMELRGTLPQLLEILSCSANMLADGHVFEPKEEITKAWVDSCEGTVASPVRSSVIPHDYKEPHHISIHVKGTDHARVRKVMSEVLARCKAEAHLLLYDDENRDRIIAAKKAFKVLEDEHS
jgi:hypothetical protein